MMTHLTCPQCSTHIPASNINVEEKIAVCPACDTVFRFDTPETSPAKVKHRKVKQPANLTLREDNERLEMAFRTNFRLDQDSFFIENGLTAVAFIVVTLLFLLGIEALGALFLLPLIAVLFLLYRLGLRLFNRTHIVADDTAIQVSRQPLRNPLGQEYTIDLSGVERIRCEETDASKREKYDTPRYRVFAEMVDGSEKLIVNDIVEDYGFFIAAQLQEYIASQHEDSENVSEALQDEVEAEVAVSNSEAAYHPRESANRLSGSTFSK